MDRRSAIKNITLSFGTITLSTGTISMIQSCQTNSTDWSPKFFSLAQINFLDRVLEIIIPETDSPGAKSLKLVRFVDAYLYKNFRTAEQEFVLSAMQDFINMILESENGIIKGTKEEQFEIIDKIFESINIENNNE